MILKKTIHLVRTVKDTSIREPYVVRYLTAQNEVNEELIIGYDGVHEDLPYIEIYNDYRE